MRYKIQYYYLATGMEGRPDEETWGWYEGNSEEDAKKNAVNIRYPDTTESDKQWIIGCLSVVGHKP